MTDTEASRTDNSRNATIIRTVEIVSAFVQHNAVPIAEIPNLIRTIHTTLIEVSAATGIEGRIDSKPAVSVRRSITADFIICLEDGKKLKMLKRYLRTRYQLSPDQYRQKWGLPADYPMVAQNYAAQRSAFAKEIGLGRSREKIRQKRK